jgi:predicted RecB family nuclease
MFQSNTQVIQQITTIHKIPYINRTVYVYSVYEAVSFLVLIIHT